MFREKSGGGQFLPIDDHFSLIAGIGAEGEVFTPPPPFALPI